MTPLPDRVVVVVILATIGLCFALAFWTVRLQPSEPPLQWRDGPSVTSSLAGAPLALVLPSPRQP